jgi:AraC-like DNA-binding protein
MSDTSEAGVLYTEHVGLRAGTPIASLWSFESCDRRGRPIVSENADGSREYWLDRSDPLLNTMLPGTAVSLVVNFGDPWAVGRCAVASALLPRLSVIGPATRLRLVRVGRFVQAIGAAVPAPMTPALFGAPPARLVDRIVPLQEFLGREASETLMTSFFPSEPASRAEILRDGLLARLGRADGKGWFADEASRIIRLRAGRVAIRDLASGYGIGREQFARRFSASAGLPPKLFARITRFQALVQTLLSNDVSEWTAIGPGAGFYDQAHMINEFRHFAGSSPTVFFRPHDRTLDPARVRLHGRPSEWLCRQSTS